MNHLIYFCLFLFSINISSFCALTELEIDEIKEKIKTNKFCKNYLNGICCVDDPGILSSGSTPSSLLSQDTVIPKSSKDKPKFSKAGIFQGLDITNLNQVTLILQPQNIETLKIVGSPRITGISNAPGAHPFSNLPSIKSLDLSYNFITFESRAEVHAFHYSQNLIELNLSFNNISSTGILMQALKPLKNLQSLYLNNNRKLNFEHEDFPVGLTKLEFLDLSYCHIWYLHEHVFKPLINLKALHLEGNDLPLIPASLCFRPSMQIFLAKTHIDASYQKLVEEDCTVKSSFDLPLSNDKKFRIVDNDRWNLSVWFYLFLLSSFLSASLILFFFYKKQKKIIQQKCSCF